MELSDTQFERLVGMLADNRVALTNAISDLKSDLDLRLAGIEKNQLVLQSSVDCLEPELNQIHTALRTQATALEDHGKELAIHGQALDGVTQLTKSCFDVVESINQRDLAESKHRAPSADVERQTQ